MSRANRLTSFEEYRKRFFPGEQDDSLYDNPAELGKKLAEQHLQMVKQTLQDWNEKRSKPKPKTRTAKKPK